MKQLGGPPLRVHLAFVADNASITQDGKLDAMGIFNSIFATEVPTTHLLMYFVMNFIIEDVDRGRVPHLAIVFRDPNGEPLFGFESDAAIHADTPLGSTLPQVIRLQGVRFDTFGDYNFVITIDGQDAATVPLRLVRLGGVQGA